MNAEFEYEYIPEVLAKQEACVPVYGCMCAYTAHALLHEKSRQEANAFTYLHAPALEDCACLYACTGPCLNQKPQQFRILSLRVPYCIHL